jgi:Ca-activated chloride channel family protein
MRRIKEIIKGTSNLIIQCTVATTILSWLIFSTIIDSREHHTIGNQQYTNEQFQEALRAYHISLIYGPSQIETYYNTAVTYIKMRDYRLAIENLEFFIRNTGDDMQKFYGYFAMGIANYSQGDLHEAAGAFRQALRLNQNDTDTRYNLELIMRQIANQASAVQQPTANSDSASDADSQLSESTNDMLPAEENSNFQTAETTQPLSRTDAERLLDAVQAAIPAQLQQATPAAHQGNVMDW